MGRSRTSFAPGRSGNPGGRPKTIAAMQELARAHTPEAIASLVTALNSPRERVAAAVALLDRAPDDRELLLTRATTLELAGRSEEAEKRLAELQSRWPEWQAVWVAEGFVLSRHGKVRATPDAKPQPRGPTQTQCRILIFSPAHFSRPGSSNESSSRDFDRAR